MPTPAQNAILAIRQLIRTNAPLPQSVSRTMPPVPGNVPIPASSNNSLQASAAGVVLQQLLQLMMALGKPPVVAVTSAPLGSGTYVATGVGGFTGAPAVVNAVNLVNGDLVLVNAQAAGLQNGAYVVIDAAAGTWERAVGCQNGDEIYAGQQAWNLNTNELYILQGPAPNPQGAFIVGTDATLWALFSTGGGSGVNVVDGSGVVGALALSTAQLGGFAAVRVESVDNSVTTGITFPADDGSLVPGLIVTIEVNTPAASITTSYVTAPGGTLPGLGGDNYTGQPGPAASAHTFLSFYYAGGDEWVRLGAIGSITPD